MWTYKRKEITNISELPQPSHAEGFVYFIKNSKGQKYIGKKSFWSRITLPPLKGKKRKRKVVKESNWLQYNSSNDVLKESDIICKEILEVCYSKLQLTYTEVKYQFLYNVLEEDDYLNNNILGKFYADKINPS
jgi:hypothetical protein